MPCSALPCPGVLCPQAHLRSHISDYFLKDYFFKSLLCFNVVLQFGAVLQAMIALFILFYFFPPFFFLKNKGSVVTGNCISYFLWQHVPIKFISLFVLLWLIFKVIENGTEVIAGKIDLTVLHKCQQRQGDTFREVTIRALTAKARQAHVSYPSNRLTPARGIWKTMPKMRHYIKRDSGPGC